MSAEGAPLGSTSAMIPRIVFGCAPIGGHDYGVVDDDESVDAIRCALDVGINCFDTADVYGLGHSEEVLGRALVGRRHEAFVATKVGVAFDQQGRTRRDLSSEYIRSAVEASLRRLRTDVIDLYQIHWPDPARRLSDALHALVALRTEGKIRYVGVCNLTREALREAVATTRLESIQVSYNLVDWEQAGEVRGIVDEHRLTPLTYNSLAQGLLSGKYERSAYFSGTDRRQRSGYFHGEKQDAVFSALARLRAVAKRYGRSASQTALRWILDSWPRSCAMVGLKRASQVKDVLRALNWTLSEVDVEDLRERSRIATVPT